MINFYRLLFVAFALILTTNLTSQTQVPKIYTKPVLMHYMPWFNSPEYSGSWGWHWTMNNKNPDVIIDPQTGKREIASHYYPLIGPYACKDPDVVEYHLLLMKYAGIDGVLVDWYGVQGTNGDIAGLLENSNALIDQVDDVGLSFALVLEDRFSASIADVQANMAYARDNYFTNSSFYRHGPNNDPLVGIFGPITFQTEADWNAIMPSAGEDVELLPLWYEEGEGGAHSDGEYVWIYEDENLDDYYSRLESFYSNRAAGLNTVMGVGYPGFEDYYAEGGAGSSYFTIPHDNGATLDATLGLVSQYDNDIDILQLATWNDYGEGTIFEPTFEFGYDYLVKLQQFLGVEYGQYELEQVHRLFNLRKEYLGNWTLHLILNRVFTHFGDLEVVPAVALMDSIEGVVVEDGYYLIQNRWNSQYLQNDNGTLVYGTEGDTPTYYWMIESVNDSVNEIKNVASDGYLNIENQLTYVEVGSRSSEWESSKWLFDDTDNSYFRIRSLEAGDKLHLENLTGSIEYGGVGSDWQSAQWRLIPVVVTEIRSAESQWISIYPNPGISQIHIEVNDKVIGIEVYEVSGKKVMDFDVSSIGNIDISELSSGVYFLKVIGAKQEHNTKIIKE